MASKKFDALLSRIEEIRHEPVSAASAAELRKALGHKSGYLIGKAASVASHLRVSELIPDLVTAFERLTVDPVKTDPQCWGKNGVATALAELGHNDPVIFLRGLRHVQLEPVWGGTEDTAGTLRARCALALVECSALSDTELLRALLTLLIDGEKGVRIAGAQAIARVNRPEAALLLRLKALAGDSEAEVTGVCLSGVLSIENLGGLEFAADFLKSSDPDVVAEAGLALGLSRLPDAVPLLVQRYQGERDAALATVLLTALAVSHHSSALEHLLQVVGQDDSNRAIAAIEALRSAGGVTDEVQGRLLETARRNPDSRVLAAMLQRTT